ncbi:MAG: hypothetical protein OXI59_19135 [Gemmatimonadota bacterium]|nr:hypothetical protein [Gemmatimonadota bacterium]
MPDKPKPKFLSAKDTSFRFGPKDGLVVISGLVGSDAITYTDVEAYNVQMDVSGNKQFVRTSEQGTVMTINLMASSAGAAHMRKFVEKQENGSVGFFEGVVTNPGQGTLELEGGVITRWPPGQAMGDGAVGDLSFQVTFTYFRNNAAAVQTGGRVGVVQAA